MHSALCVSMKPMPPMSARQVVDRRAPSRGLVAGLALPQVEPPVVGAGDDLMPLVERLDVHGANAPMALAPQVGNKMAADESACSGDDDHVIRVRAPVAHTRCILALQPQHRDMCGGPVWIDSCAVGIHHMDDSALPPDLRPVVEHRVRIRDAVAGGHGVPRPAVFTQSATGHSPTALMACLIGRTTSASLAEIVRVRDKDASSGHPQHLQNGSSGLRDVMQRRELAYEIERFVVEGQSQCIAVPELVRRQTLFRGQLRATRPRVRFRLLERPEPHS